MSELNLKGKMNNWGPFEEKEYQWLIFSVGNPNEGHGLAIPRATDDFHAKKAAFDLQKHTGQRYVAHIPYTTDSVGEVAKDWSPNYLPWEEFFQKSIDFMKYHVNLIREKDENISRVILITGHGGNRQILEEESQQIVQEKLNLNKFLSITSLVERSDASRVLGDLKKVAQIIIEERGTRFGYSDPAELTDFYTRILLSAGHASHVEHSLMACLGMCDLEKVKIMNKLLEKDFEKALRKWPPIGGLGGYLLAGGKYLDALKTVAPNEDALWNCFNGLKNLNNGKLIIAPELGELIFKVGLAKKTELINKYL
jgi:hypothetical protein